MEVTNALAAMIFEAIKKPLAAKQAACGQRRRL
jgi:hypothetical protein